MRQILARFFQNILSTQKMLEWSQWWVVVDISKPGSHTCNNTAYSLFAILSTFSIALLRHFWLLTIVIYSWCRSLMKLVSDATRNMLQSSLFIWNCLTNGYHYWPIRLLQNHTANCCNYQILSQIWRKSSMIIYFQLTHGNEILLSLEECPSYYDHSVASWCMQQQFSAATIP